LEFFLAIDFGKQKSKIKEDYYIANLSEIPFEKKIHAS